jgi:NitT/TauT family transport system ATP-binding protein
VVTVIPVTLPRPRDQIETKASDEFVHLRSEVARLIRSGGLPSGRAFEEEDVLP